MEHDFSIALAGIKNQSDGSLPTGVYMNSREELLMQIWRDYYDEILDVSLDRGTFESLINPDSKNARKGFVEIEVMLVSRKNVHPDDRSVFTQFFDKNMILEGMKKGTFVRKLNFRMHRGDGKYFWVKVKGIMPSKGNEEEKKYFVCFRILDNASDEDMSYRKLLSVSLMHEKEISSQLKGLCEKFASEVRSPLNDILGLADIAKSTVTETEKTAERLRLIIEKTTEINDLMEHMLLESRKKNEEIALRDDESFCELVAKTGKNMLTAAEETDAADQEDEEDSANDAERTLQKIGVGAMPMTADPEDFDFTGKNLLVVADSELGSEILLELLTKRGAIVTSICSGKEAVKDFIVQPPHTYDLVLVDIGVEDLDGYSVAHCIRLSCKEDAGTVPIFALSTKGVAESIVNTRENGVNMIFSKPVDYGMLFLKMHEAMA